MKLPEPWFLCHLHHPTIPTKPISPSDCCAASRSSDLLPYRATMALLRCATELANSTGRAAPWLQLGSQLLRRSLAAQAQPAEEEDDGMWLRVLLDCNDKPPRQQKHNPSLHAISCCNLSFFRLRPTEMPCTLYIHWDAVQQFLSGPSPALSMQPTSPSAMPLTIHRCYRNEGYQAAWHTYVP